MFKSVTTFHADPALSTVATTLQPFTSIVKRSALGYGGFR